MNFCKLYYKDRVHGISCKLLAFEYIMPVLPYALIFHFFNYNYYETFARIVCCEDIWCKGDLNTTEESPWKAYWQYLIRW